MDNKTFSIDKKLLLKLLGKTSTRKITDSTLSKYFKKPRIQILNKTQKSGFNNYEVSASHSPAPLFKDSITVQKMKLLSQKEKIFQTPSKRDLSCLTERCISLKTPNSSSNNIKPRCSNFSCKSKTNTFRQEAPLMKMKFLNFPKLRIMQKVTFREAMKDLEWSLKARPEIDKLWRNILNRSNGLEVNALGGSFKVFIGKGNNSGLVKKCFDCRPWWTRVDCMSEADFVWTQWKIDDFVNKLPSGTHIKIMKKHTLQATSLCPIHIKGEDQLLKMVTIDELNFQSIRNSPSYTFVESDSKSFSGKLYNRLERNQVLTDKKGLFETMKSFYLLKNQDPFENLPITFHVTSTEDPSFSSFTEYFLKCDNEKLQTRSQNLWILKPAEKSNRGQGISICNSLQQIISILSSCKDPERSMIIQKYIEKPFLIHRRKFDFRCFAMVTSINSVFQGYFYSDGYIRTASSEFSTRDISDHFKHLTNDAIQKHGEDYGKFEDGNKMSYREFQRYLDNHFNEKKIQFIKDILPKIKDLVKDSFKASFREINPAKRLNCMEILGYDFMIDSNFKPWLIEVNTNPCLELSSNLLGVIIPAMLENALKIAIDPLFPPGPGKTPENFTENKFELVFHELIDG